MVSEPAFLDMMEMLTTPAPLAAIPALASCKYYYSGSHSLQMIAYPAAAAVVAIQQARHAGSGRTGLAAAGH